MPTLDPMPDPMLSMPDPMLATPDPSGECATLHADALHFMGVPPAVSVPCAAASVPRQSLGEIRAAVDAPRQSLGETRDAARTLHVILPYCNPCAFQRRRVLFDQTVAHMQRVQADLAAAGSRDRVCIVTVEAEYHAVASCEADLAESANRVSLSLKLPHNQVLWSKENLINCAISVLHSMDATYIAWVDADIEFEGTRWVSATMDAIDGIVSSGKGGAIVQMFEHADLLDMYDVPMRTVTSFGAQFMRGKTYTSVRNTSADYWHPGFAWAADAATLYALADVFGVALIECTLGGADRHMAMSLLRMARETLPVGISVDYANMVLRWDSHVAKRNVGLGAVLDTRIKHYWHGTLENRRYVERWNVLIENNFMPSEHMFSATLWFGPVFSRHFIRILCWSPKAPLALRSGVLRYLMERDEDDIYHVAMCSKSSSPAPHHSFASMDTPQGARSYGSNPYLTDMSSSSSL